MSRRLLLAERDGPTRAGIRVALVDAGFELVAVARERNGAIEAALEHRPDVALVSTDLPGGGIEVVQAIAESLPGTKLISLSARPNGQELLAAVLAGAVGYLSKEMSPVRLPQALQGVMRGEVALPRRHTQHLLDALRGRENERTLVTAQANAPLTDREWEVLRLLGDDASTVQMAQRLGISQVTVRRHVSSLLSKLGVTDRAGAAMVLRRSAN